MTTPAPKHAHPPATPMRAARSGPLKGRVRVPGDKSISHRALIFGLLSVGTTEVSGLLEGEDVIRTAAAARALGADVERLGPGLWRVQGVGIGSLLQPTETLDFGNAGTGSRLMMGVVGGHPITARFDGDASLRKRPMGRILTPLALMGARASEMADGERLPLTLTGAQDAIPITYESPVPSAQVKSAVLFAGLNAPGETSVIEREATRDHTEKMLAYFGAEIRSTPHGAHGRAITLVGQPELVPQPIVVPADPSSSAFPIVAALITPGSDIIVEGVMMNPLRTGLIATLREMGARIEALDERIEGGENVADLRVRHSDLQGVTVPADRAPSMIDEYPILAVAAAYAAGETRMLGLAELRVKESDRLQAVADGLRANGIDCAIVGDDLHVRGLDRNIRGGGLVATHMDHRIAMSFLIMGLRADAPVEIDDAGFIATSFPGFVPMLKAMGADLT